VVYILTAAAISIIYTEIEVFVSFPLFEGPILTTLWTFSLVILLALALSLYHRGRFRTKYMVQTQMKVADYIDQQLAGRLKPVEGAVAGVQTAISGLSDKVTNLTEEVRKLPPILEDQAKAVRYQTRMVVSVDKNQAWREQQYRETVAQYNKWYDQRVEASKALDALVNSAQGMLDKFALYSDQVDELLDSLEVAGRRPAVEEGANARPGQGESTPQNSPAVGVTSSGGKLTKEKGIANREKGNRAQLQFSEEVLRKASKVHNTSFKEGTADFVFYVPDTPIVKAIGAFKALTLSEGGTKQRWIPRRKLLAEQRLALKVGVPLVLFVQNLLNGRIWAKVLAVEELKGFTGLTTPLLLIENDPRAEKTCKETLEMALQLL
jgi:hypothetical protein